MMAADSQGSSTLELFFDEHIHTSSAKQEE